MKNTHIAVLDDGINEKYACILLKHNIEIDDSMRIIERAGYDDLLVSHGTICAAIIHHYYVNAEISSVKILDSAGLGNKNKLLKAIEWCIDSNVDIINLSAGTIDFRDMKELQAIVDKALERGIFIVAANHNDDKITYPAFFYNVLGVKCDSRDELKEGQFLYHLETWDGIQITACGRHDILNSRKESWLTSNWNSYAAPMITGLIAEIIERNPGISFEETKRKLWGMSQGYLEDYNFHESHPDLNWVRNALVFNFNINGDPSGMYIFKTKKAIDISFESIKEAIGYVARYINSCCMLDEIDTLILDFVGYDMIDSQDILEEFLKKIKPAQKNVVLLNECITNKAVSNLLKLYSPISYTNDFLIINHEDIVYNDIPYVIVLGNSDEKLTKVSMNLIGRFREEGYNAIAFTNDIRSILFGCYYIDMKCNSRNDIRKYIYNVANAYNADICFIGVNVSYCNESFINWLTNIFDIDICIAIENKKECPIFDKVLNNFEGEILRLMQFKDTKEGQYINLSDKFYINSLYGQILTLFE